MPGQWLFPRTFHAIQTVGRVDLEGRADSWKDYSDETHEGPYSASHPTGHGSGMRRRFYAHAPNSHSNIHSNACAHGCPYAYSGTHDAWYINKEFDLLVEQARVEGDTEVRLAYYREAEQLLMDDAGIIPLFHVQDFVLVRPHVEGFRMLPVGQPDLTGIRLNPIPRSTQECF